MSDLLPCPFCGGEADVYKHDRAAFGTSYHVECQEEACGCGTCHHESRDEAIAAWNTRVVDHPVTSTPVVDHETGNMSDNDLIERVKTVLADASGGWLTDAEQYQIAKAAIAAIDLPGQREAAARAALEAARDAVEGYMADCLDDKDVQRQWPRTFSRNLIYGKLVRAIDPAAFRGGNDAMATD